MRVSISSAHAPGFTIATSPYASMRAARPIVRHGVAGETASALLRVSSPAAQSTQ